MVSETLLTPSTHIAKFLDITIDVAVVCLCANDAHAEHAQLIISIVARVDLGGR